MGPFALRARALELGVTTNALRDLDTSGVDDAARWMRDLLGSFLLSPPRLVTTLIIVLQA